MTKNIILAACISLLTTSAFADDLNVPEQISWSAYGISSNGHNQTVAIGTALKNAYGTNLRLLSGKNDIARAEPLRQAKVNFATAGIGGVYMASKSVFASGTARWGPQKVRVLMQNAEDKFGFALAATEEACEAAGGGTLTGGHRVYCFSAPYCRQPLSWAAMIAIPDTEALGMTQITTVLIGAALAVPPIFLALNKPPSAAAL